MTPSTRERIVIAAAELFRRQGYNGTGLKQVVAEADAPFGSLYHHFPGGKQQLTEEVLRAAGAFFLAHALSVYDAAQEDPVRTMFAAAADTLEATDFQDACPIETIALEVASTNDHLRRVTAEVFETWTGTLAQRLGDRDAALAVIAALEGAFVLARAQRSTAPLLAAGEMAAVYVSAAAPAARR